MDIPQADLDMLNEKDKNELRTFIANESQRQRIQGRMLHFSTLSHGAEHSFLSLVDKVQPTLPTTSHLPHSHPPFPFFPFPFPCHTYLPSPPLLSSSPPLLPTLPPTNQPTFAPTNLPSFYPPYTDRPKLTLSHKQKPTT